MRWQRHAALRLKRALHTNKRAQVLLSLGLVMVSQRKLTQLQLIKKTRDSADASPTDVLGRARDLQRAENPCVKATTHTAMSAVMNVGAPMDVNVIALLLGVTPSLLRSSTGKHVHPLLMTTLR
jgi:hypothetical protein